MPTPVSVVREFLTPEATLAVDEAVVIARKRNHAQTTSIHALSAFLSLPNFPLLQDSISRVRSSIYSSRLQLKALKLCFNVSLDRIPSSKSKNQKNHDDHGGGDGSGGGPDDDDEPPISNSFMAAIKRSQATQKRYPENFHLNQQNQNTVVKVELQPLILSILDDPVVSRVFSEAGFRNYDIKVSILRPPPSTTSSRVFSSAPLFLCNFTDNDEISRKGFSFPFSSGFSNPGGLSNSDDEMEFKRIVEVLLNKEQRNPLLVGVSANDVLHSFEEICGRRGGDVAALPAELTGLRFISIEKEVLEFMNGNENEGLLVSKFQELERLVVQSCSGPGIVISFGDLKGLVDGNCDGSFIVTELMKLLEHNSAKKLWLMGSASSYETYLKLIRTFPSVEKDWDLKLVPITSIKATIGSVCARPHSLKESFVPLGGFFSTPSDLRPPASNNPSTSCCNLCNEKYEQELSSILEGGSIVSVSDHYKSSFSSWMHPDELSPDKVNVDTTVLNAKVVGLQKKWNDICQRLGHTSPTTKAEISRVGSQLPLHIVGFPVAENRKDNVHPSPSKSLSGNVSPSTASPKLPALNHKIPIQLVSEGKDDDIRQKLQHVRPLRSDCFHIEGLSAPATSVTTDLGLGTLYASNPKKKPNSPIFQAHKERLQEFFGCSPLRVDVVSTNASSTPIRPSSTPILPSSYSNTHVSGNFDLTDIKTLWQSIVKRVGRQNEVIYDVSETISHCKTENGRRRGTSLRGDIWLSFLGPDRVAKKRIAEALAEIICGSKENLTAVDLCSEDGMTCSGTIFGSQELNDYDLKFRGKTVVDYIAEEIRKKPFSVVFLDNVDKADPIAQESLIQAIKTGKLHQWNGREVAVNHTIFIATSEVMKDRKNISSRNEHIKFPEQRILRAKSWQIQISVGRVAEGTAILKYSSVSLTSGTFVNKRKLIGINETIKQPEIFERIKKACKTSSSNYLDLNLPAEEETEENDANCSNSESNSASEISETWLEDFFDRVDKNVVFNPFDFDTLADKVLKEIDKTLRDTFDESSKILLEIDLKVMEQMLAAAWLSDDKASIEAWVSQVLGRSFTEIRQQCLNGRITSGSVLKLVPCEGVPMKEEANTIRLPATIILNLQ
ncbi:protein SMAX1-LIKE 6-like [Papaver somniferum]|uniref:protein SMAX1-LIKE 6-like n=1 Tax=Papaver somniferum TaxID=3469 RepID=UPI000E70430D|nr:protein SMAX1-LIKE 6-like [Papaver somniferum]